MAMAKTASLDRLKLMPSQAMPDMSRVTIKHPRVKLLPMRRLAGMASDLAGKSSSIPIGMIKIILSELVNIDSRYLPSLFAVCGTNRSPSCNLGLANLRLPMPTA